MKSSTEWLPDSDDVLIRIKVPCRSKAEYEAIKLVMIREVVPSIRRVTTEWKTDLELEEAD